MTSITVAAAGFAAAPDVLRERRYDLDQLAYDREKLFRRACEMDLEGIVSKRADAPYRSGRTRDWTKRTCRQRETFVVAGIAHKNKKFDGIYLARRDEDDLIYAGKVENGFDEAATRDLERRAKKLITRKQPLTKRIATSGGIGPQMLEYGWTDPENLQRHFHGSRSSLFQPS